MEYDFNAFVRDGAEAETPLPLAAGHYSVECVYEKTDTEVPWGGAGFELSSRAVAGLWTGRVAAAPVTLDVPRAKIVTLRMDGPADFVPGHPYPLAVVLENATEQPLDLTGVFALEVGNKALGPITARLLLDATVHAAEGEATQHLVVAAGEIRRWEIDLSGVQFHSERVDSTKPLTLAQHVPEGLFPLSLQFAPKPTSRDLASNGLWRNVRPANGSK